MIPRLLITPGEPGGIGPDLVLQLATHTTGNSEWVAVADPALLRERAEFLKLYDIRFETIDADSQPAPNQKNQVKVIPVTGVQVNEPGKLHSENSPYVVKTLALATDLCLETKAHGMVTGPVQKSIINDAGIAFSGHTEFLQERCGVDQVVMMLATDELKVALVTTHLPLKAVPDAITQELLHRVLKVLTQSLAKDFGLPQAKILVAGLNPHAGEQGHLGREEIDVIEPVLKQWQDKGHQLIGPLPADTLYAKHWLAQADATLAMYHDQGLPVLKHSGFGKAVNITLGLPIIRTSVDHGTALDLAGTGNAQLGSLVTALNYAENMAHHRFKLGAENNHA